MAVFDMHHPWALVFGVLGNFISICVYCAPIPTFLRIIREKSTLGFQSLPYVVALFSSLLWIYYAIIKTNALLLVSINSFGIIIESIYVVIFLIYAQKSVKMHTLKLLTSLNLGLLPLIFVITYFTFNESVRVSVVGWVCVAISACVFAAPLSILFKVIKTRSVEYMPFALSFTLTVSAMTWFGYGMLINDLCVALPNVLGFFLGILQMLLYVIYRNGDKEEKFVENELGQHVININVTLPRSEVHPVDSPPKGGLDDEGICTLNQIRKEEKEDEEDKDKWAKFAPEIEIVQVVPPLLVVCAA